MEIKEELSELSIDELKQLAEEGNLKAKLHLGMIYDKGIRVKHDYKEAEKWYKEAADGGDIIAKCNLGVMYRKGLDGVLRSDEEAVKLYREAADGGSIVAQCNLGFMYENGLGGLNQSYEEAALWYEKAAEKGNYASAQYNLALIYHLAKMGSKDLKKAFYWYEKAAKQDHAKAQCNLGVMYLKGHGTEKNVKKATLLYYASAKNGNQHGKTNIENLAVSFFNRLFKDQEKNKLKIFNEICDCYEKIVDDRSYEFPSKFRLRNLINLGKALEGEDDTLKEIAISIYNNANKIIDALHVKFNHADDSHGLIIENKIAHYISKNWTLDLIRKEQPLRLIPIQFMNDPTEGKLLDNFIGKQEQDTSTSKNTEHCFIKSFSFNYNSLNQFRLYGKQNKEEATGLSLVFSSEFFADNIKNIKEYKDQQSLDMDQQSLDKKQMEIEPENLNEQEQENLLIGKLPLYRCIYLDPESMKQKDSDKWIVDLGKADAVSYMRGTKKTYKDYREYVQKIDNLANEVRQYLGDLSRNYQELHEQLNEDETYTVFRAIHDIMLPLSYLTKHYAFKEEQECRCITVQPLGSSLIQADEDEHIYIDMDYITGHLSEIYLGIKAKDSKLYIEKTLCDFSEGKPIPTVYVSDAPFQ